MFIDKEIKKVNLEKTHISHYTLSQITKGLDVLTDVLRKVYLTLDCSVDDIMEFPEHNYNKKQ